MIKHVPTAEEKKINNINTISFVMGLSTANLAYITSSYLKISIGTDKIGLFYFSAYFIILLILLNLHKIVRKFGKSNTFFTFLCFKITALLTLIMIPANGFSPLVLIAFLVSGGAAAVCLDIILESFSTNGKSGRIRGMHLMILNTGFIFGPIVSTQILANFNYQIAFSLSFFLEILILAMAWLSLDHINHETREDLKIIDIAKKIFKRRNVLRIYYISVTLEFFYALMIVYSPIYLRDLGMSWGNIGLAFTVMLMPFVFLPYLIGYLADKRLGEKEMLIFAIFFITAGTIAVYLTDSVNVLVWALVLLSTRIGAAMIDTLRDSYFYKKINGDDIDLIDFFRTAVSVGYISATVLSFVLLIFFPTRAIFILLAIVTFSALYPAFRLVDNKCEAELICDEDKKIT